MSYYRHTQIGWVIISIAIVLLPILVLSSREGEILLFLIPAAVIGAILALFATLTLDVDDRRLLIRFGIGAIRRAIALSAIRAYAPVRNPWYYGWGVRLTPYGMLYNVSGRSAVELLLEDGRRVRVGTDEPELLLRALETATRIPHAASIEEFPKDAGWRRRVGLLMAIVGGIVAMWVIWTFYAYRQPPDVEVTADRFAVSVGLHSAELPISEIQAVQLLQEVPRIVRRTNGFSSGRLMRGNFIVEEWGSGRLFINRGIPPYVAARTNETFVIVNFEDPERTRDLYRRLRLRVLVR
jgi:hypothetical protein